MLFRPGTLQPSDDVRRIIELVALYGRNSLKFAVDAFEHFVSFVATENALTVESGKQVFKGRGDGKDSSVVVESHVRSLRCVWFGVVTSLSAALWCGAGDRFPDNACEPAKSGMSIGRLRSVGRDLEHPRVFDEFALERVDDLAKHGDLVVGAVMIGPRSRGRPSNSINFRTERACHRRVPIEVKR